MRKMDDDGMTQCVSSLRVTKSALLALWLGPHLAAFPDNSVTVRCC